MRFLLIVSLLFTGCATTPTDWNDTSDMLGYRLLTKADFKANHSYKAWGNVAHEAEVCVNIVAVKSHDVTGAFRAVLKQSCSYWNRGSGRLLWNAIMLALNSNGLPSMGLFGSGSPDWYVLQHEQLHFTIVHAQALWLSKRTAKRSAEPTA